MITQTDTTHVVDRHKTRREEKKIKTTYQQGNDRQMEPLKPNFNSKKHRGTLYQKIVAEEHDYGTRK